MNSGTPDGGTRCANLVTKPVIMLLILPMRGLILSNLGFKLRHLVMTEHLGSPTDFWWDPCCLSFYFFVFFFFYLRSVSCVSNVASVSGLSILDRPFGFLETFIIILDMAALDGRV
jgi:hypothetical protein